ncbi:hypothetical protein [Streptomyces ficellus]|uniref:Uncharacterized protein n=1 Tax=Streptomyces ficellus TaxID=1977088 RepID=A0A6I6FJD3_9ACTN|nr:hypothetical protein EIZ62_19810 [Streptomyces ficellus]
MSGRKTSVACAFRPPGLRAGAAAAAVALVALVAAGTARRLRATKTSPPHHRDVTRAVVPAA